MTIEEFKNKWLGKKIDYDGVYDNQCTDLTKQWLRELGYEVSGAWGNAKDWDKNGSRPNLKWIANTPTGVPSPGDIIVFTGGTYGHVAIFLSGDANSFQSLDQNYPSGKLEPVGIFTHKYTGSLSVKGWLHPTVLDAPVTPPAPVDVCADVKSQLANMTEKAQKLQVQCNTLIEDKEAAEEEFDRKVYAKEQEIIELKDKIGKKDTEILILRETVKSLQNTVTPVIVHEMSEEDKKILSLWGKIKSFFTREK